MADIVEVVHKINYDIDDRALVNISRVLQLQLQELQELNRSFTDLQRQIQATANTEKQLLSELSNKADALLKRLETSAGKTKGIFEQLGNGLLKGLGGGDGLEGVVTKFIEPAMKKIAETATLSELSIAGIGAELLSFGNIVTAGIGLLVLFDQQLSNNTQEAELYRESLEKVGDEGQRVGEAASDEMAKLFVLRATVENVTLEYDKRKAAMDELLDLYPEYFKQLKEEDILVGKVGNAYAEVVTNILNRARLEVFKENLKESVSSLEKVKSQLQQLKGNRITDRELGMDPNRTVFGMLPTYDINSIDQAIPALLMDKLREYNELANAINSNIGNVIALEKEIQKNKPKPDPYIGGESHNTQPKEKQSPAPELKIAVPDNPKEGESTVNEMQERALQAKRGLIQDELDTDSEWEKEERTALETHYANGLISFEDYEKEKLNIQKRYASLRRKAEIKGLEEILRDDNIAQEAKQTVSREIADKKLADKEADNAEKHNKEEKAAKDKTTAEENRRQRIKDTIKAYQDLASEAVKAINIIYDAQIKVLDNEIKVREKRVEAAKKLAERGNTEALRLEEERLAAAQKKKEEYAKKEAVLNAALAFSNSMVAVTGAIATATKGDGYTLAARVAIALAAVLGALASGYAFVQSFKSDGAFADGVVDFKGKGGPRDDANWVRISSGESVITAAGTQKHRSLLEAINKGEQLQFINPALAYTMPMFANPQKPTSSYVSQVDLYKVEDKLDGVINAIEDNRLKQNIYFNEHGVGIMTERAIRKDRKRWI